MDDAIMINTKQVLQELKDAKTLIDKSWSGSGAFFNLVDIEEHVDKAIRHLESNEQ